MAFAIRNPNRNEVIYIKSHSNGFIMSFLGGLASGLFIELVKAVIIVAR